MKILVIQTAFLGDAILGTAVLEDLHARFPEADIDYLIRKGHESLFAGHPFINHVFVWDKKGEKYKGLWKILSKTRSNHYDWVINLQRFAATGLLTGFSGAKERIGFDKNPFSFLFSKKIKHHFTGHEVERNQMLVDAVAGKYNRLPMPKLYPLEIHYEKVKALQEAPYITIAPASVWFTKQLPSLKWRELIENIDRPLNVFLIGSKADKEIAEDILQSIKNPIIEPFNICGNLNLLETAVLMEGALMNYTNDSGPMHMASAMNAPTRAVYCSTIPEFGFGPLSDNSKIMETKKELSCRPCGIHGRKECPRQHFDCAYTIEMKPDF